MFKKIIKNMTTINSKSLFALGVLTASLFVLPLIVMAIPPTTVYNLGQTLDPNCAPGATNCTVTTPSPSTGTTTLVTVGTIATGVWNGTVIDTTYGGTGTSTIGTVGTVAYSDGTDYAFTATGTSGYYLQANGDNAPVWAAVSAGAWTTSGDDIYYTTGNVGIGTTTPATGLSVQYSSTSTSGMAAVESRMTSPGGLSANLYITGYKSTLNGHITDSPNSALVGYDAYLESNPTSSVRNTALLVRGGWTAALQTQNQELKLESLDVGGGGDYDIYMKSDDDIVLESADEISFDGAMIYIPSSDTSISADASISITDAVQRIVGNSGVVDMTVDPQVATSTATDGQIVIIQGTDDTNTVKLDDGTGLALSGGVSFTLGKNDIISLVYDSGEDEWIELYRSDNS